MTDESLIREIIGTYELSEKLKEKIIRIATFQIEEKKLTSFDDQYRYISYLVEKFRFPFEEISALRLDHIINYDSKTTFHSVIGVDDPNLSKMFEDNENIGITANEAINLLTGQIDELDLKLMRQLLKQDITARLNVSPEEILESIKEIQERLEILIRKYERERRLVIPKRPVIYIEFDPFFIKFGRRRYNGDPLAFFMEHIDVYGGMRRSELKYFDQGLYRTLLKSNQLNEAIPEKWKRKFRGYKGPLDYFLANIAVYKGMRRIDLSNFDQNLYYALRMRNQLNEAIPEKYGVTYRGHKTPLDYFCSYPEKYGDLSRRQLSEVDSGLYRTLLRAKQLEIAIPEATASGKPLSQNQINEIIATHSIYKGNLLEASRHLPYATSTIWKHWNSAGLRTP